MCSRPERGWRGIVALASLALACLLIPIKLASAQQWALTLDSVDHSGFALRDVRLVWSGGKADLRLGKLRIADREWRDVKLSCGELNFSATGLDCRKGLLKLAGFASLPVSLSYSKASGSLAVVIEQASATSLAQLVPGLAAWKMGGRIDATFELTPQRVAVRAFLADASFADAAGNHAGEHLAASLHAEASRSDSGTAATAWNWTVDFAWTGGELFWQPVYLQAEQQSAHLRGSLDDNSIRIDAATTQLGKLAQVAFSGLWQRREQVLERLTLDAQGIDLDKAVTTLLQPWLDQSALPKLSASGTGSVSFEYAAGALQKLDVGLDSAALSASDAATATNTATNDDAVRFSLAGVNARIPWRRDAATQAEFSAAAGSLGRLPLGALKLPVSMNGLNLKLIKAEIPVLDGKLILENFAAHHDGDNWHWHLGGALEPIAMPLLTERLGLPRMNGVLSAAIPDIGYADGTLSLDGALVVSVFDGFLAVTGLKVVDPLGKSPRLLAEVQMRHLDLGMLTETFSFGDITGYIDGDIKGLELVNWRPQRFDAKLISSPGDYRRRISQRAVQNISSLGGAGAAAAIQRSFLNFFDTFGYSRIGLSCVLADGICRMGGVEAAPLGYVIVKGGGIPALNVIGYNRQVHWDELLSRLQAVIAGNSRPVIR